MRFFLKCYRTEVFTGPILVNLDSIRSIEPWAREGCSVVALVDRDRLGGVDRAYFKGQPDDFVGLVISVHGV
jgi:hypothetical protein